MDPLPPIPLPLQSNGVPDGFGWSERAMSTLSTTTAFNTGINARDLFLGVPRCIVCGITSDAVLEHCHIIWLSEPQLVSRKSIRALFVPNMMRSGRTSGSAIGFPARPNIHLNMNQEMASSCAATTTKRLISTNTSSVSSLK